MTPINMKQVKIVAITILALLTACSKSTVDTPPIVPPHNS